MVYNSHIHETSDCSTTNEFVGRLQAGLHLDSLVLRRFIRSSALSPLQVIMRRSAWLRSREPINFDVMGPGLPSNCRLLKSDLHGEQGPLMHAVMAKSSSLIRWLRNGDTWTSSGSVIPFRPSIIV